MGRLSLGAGEKRRLEGLSPAGVPEVCPRCGSDLLLCFLHAEPPAREITAVIWHVWKERDALPLSAAFKGARCRQSRRPQPEDHTCWMRALPGGVPGRSPPVRRYPSLGCNALATIVTTAPRPSPKAETLGELHVYKTWTRPGMSHHPFSQGLPWGRPAGAPDGFPERGKSPAAVGHPPLLPGPPRLAVLGPAPVWKEPPSLKGGCGHSPEGAEGAQRACLPGSGGSPIFRARSGYPGSGIIPETPPSSGPHRRTGFAFKARLGRGCWAANNITTLLWSIRTNYPS